MLSTAPSPFPPAAALHCSGGDKGKSVKRNQKEQWDFRSAAQMAMALLFLAMGVMIWDHKDQEELASTKPTRNSEEVYTPDTLARINRHLQWTERQTDLKALAVTVENAEFAAPTHPGPNAPPPHLQNPFASEDVAGRVLKDLEPSAGQFDNPVLPADRINTLVEQRQWMKNYDRKQTEEFIRAVQNNAHAAGYHLEINNQLKVVKVRRLPNSVVDSGRPSPAR